MILKGIIDEDIVNYKLYSMVLEFPYCSMKCDKECGQPVCQNSALATAPEIVINSMDIAERYLNNPITSAIVLQGMEPFDSYTDLKILIKTLRTYTDDDIVIYTGYNKDEILDAIEYLKNNYVNIVVKFGRYIPGQKPHHDSVLGINLASDNQYAERIS